MQCACKGGTASNWDGKCGRCRTKTDKKVLANMHKNAAVAPGLVSVHNKHRDEPTPHDFYIGRGSALGNPFPIDDAKGMHRNVVIKAYEEWINDQLKAGNTRVATALNKIANDSLEGRPVNLVCFCSPANCHGRIIKNLVDAAVRYELATNTQHK